MYAGNDGWEATAPVASYVAGKSPFGLFDMAGNVWEWTADGYSKDYGQSRDTAARVFRGGGWLYVDPAYVRAMRRSAGGRSYRGSDLGFRCAQAQ